MLTDKVFIGELVEINSLNNYSGMASSYGCGSDDDCGCEGGDGSCECGGDPECE